MLLHNLGGQTKSIMVFSDSANIKDVRWKLAGEWSMSSKLEPRIWSRDTGHFGIHGGVDVHLVVG